MHVLLVNEDNTISTTKRERIVKGSKLVDTLWILVNPIYQEQDLSNATITMEYVLPISKKYGLKFLRLVGKHQEYFKYMLPEEDEINSDLTSEAGNIEIKLTFTYITEDSNGKLTQHVRKTTTATITVVPNAEWGNLIPDSALEVLDQRLIKLDAQTKMLGEYAEFLNQTRVDNLLYNDDNETLQLQANGSPVGSPVSVRDMLDDGIPVVDMDSISGDSTGGSTAGDCGCDCGCEDNVVEFGYDTDKTEDGCACGCEDNVVEFGYKTATIIKNDSNITEF